MVSAQLRVPVRGAASGWGARAACTLTRGCLSAGNVASILELDERCERRFKVRTVLGLPAVPLMTAHPSTQIFEAAPQDARGAPAKAPMPDYFL